MSSLLPIRSHLAKNANPRGPAPEEKHTHTGSSPDDLWSGSFTQPITIFAESTGPFISPPKARFGTRRILQNAKTEKVKTRNEARWAAPTRSNEKCRTNEIVTNEPSKSLKTQRPVEPRGLFSEEVNLTSDKYGGPEILSRAGSPATLLLYVSDTRRPASPSPPSGDHIGRTGGASPLCGFQNCVAGPGLIRFCKSNERMPAAVPAGFFIASLPG
jgi:hypothetical protein